MQFSWSPAVIRDCKTVYDTISVRCLINMHCMLRTLLAFSWVMNQKKYLAVAWLGKAKMVIWTRKNLGTEMHQDQTCRVNSRAKRISEILDWTKDNIKQLKLYYGEAFLPEKTNKVTRLFSDLIWQYYPTSKWKKTWKPCSKKSRFKSPQT